MATEEAPGVTEVATEEPKPVEKWEWEWKEERIVNDLGESLSFCGMIPSRSGERFLQFYSLHPLYKADFETAAKFYGGEGGKIEDLQKRVEVLERIRERLKPVFIKSWDSGVFEVHSQVADEIQAKDQKARRKNIIDLLRGYSPSFLLGPLLEAIPDLEDRIFHAYGLARCFRGFPTGIEKVTEKSLAHEREIKRRERLTELFAHFEGEIPPKTLERFKKQGIIEEAKYSDTAFWIDLRHLFSWYVLRDEWDKAKEIAQLASPTYTKLAESAEKGYEQREFTGEAALWKWIGENMNILREDVKFIRGS